MKEERLAKKKEVYVICRSNMGVHAGVLNEKESTDDKKVMHQVIRLYRWYSPGVSLSEIAIEGPVKHSECKFSAPVTREEITSPTNGFEILVCTEAARKVIESVKAWRTQTATAATGSGYGHGSGDGDGHGYGHGYGDGSAYGDGYGDGSGYGRRLRLRLRRRLRLRLRLRRRLRLPHGYGDGYGDGSATATATATAPATATATATAPAPATATATAPATAPVEPRSQAHGRANF